jgi:hypothetical protein
MMLRRALATALLATFATTAMATPLGMAQSTARFDLGKSGAAESREVLTAMLSPGDALTAGKAPIQVTLSEGTNLLIDLASTVTATSSDMIDLIEGGVVVSRQPGSTSSFTTTVEGLGIAPVGIAADDAEALYAVQASNGAVRALSHNQSLAVTTSDGARLATLGPGDDLTFVRSDAGDWVVATTVLQAQEFIPDPSMPEEEDESRKGFFWRFWSSTIGGTAVGAGAVAAGAVVVVGGGVAVNEAVSDDNDDDGGSSESSSGPPPPVSPTNPNGKS